MKKIIALLSILVLAFTLVSCGKDKTPVFSGVSDQTIEIDSHYGYLDGISAVDYKGVDITQNITYSGTVNPGAVGTYQVTYTVFDNKKNTATATCTITVVKTDKSAPLILGARSEEIVVGSSFDNLEGVSAIDTAEGDLTSKIQVEGTVNTMVPGVYTINYKVGDSKGNNTSIDRKITVGLGSFRFGETEVSLTSSNIEGSKDVPVKINIVEYGYGLLKLVVNAEKDGKASVSISGLTEDNSYDVKQGENTLYIKLVAPKDFTGVEYLVSSSLDVVITGASFVLGVIGLPIDITPPSFIFNDGFDSSKTIYLPYDLQGAALSKDQIMNYILSLSGVRSYDKKDQQYPDVFVETIDMSIKDKVQELVLGAKDEAGNVGKYSLNLVLVSEPLAVDSLDPNNLQFIDDAKKTTYTGEDSVIRYIANIEYEKKDDVGTLHTTKSSILYYDDKLIYLLGSDISYGNYYLLTISAKATTGTFYSYFRIGQGLSVAPWQYYFSGDSKFVATFSKDEYTTYNLIIHYDKPVSDDDYGVIIEWDLAGYNYIANQVDNILNIQSFTISALSGKDQVKAPFDGTIPNIKPVLFSVGDLSVSDDLKLTFTEKVANAKEYDLILYRGSTQLNSYVVTNDFDLSTLKLADGIYNARLYYKVEDSESPLSNIAIFTVENGTVNTTITAEELQSKININGRSSINTDKSINFYYTASGFKVNFTGTLLHATFNTKITEKFGPCYLVVLVDGELYPSYGNTIILDGKNGSEYTLCTGLENKEHTVEVLKRSEASNATISLVSLGTDGTFGDAPLDRQMKILVIGASGTTGYGNLSTSTQTTENSDGLRAFPYLISQMYAADITEINASGWGVLHGWNNTTGNDDTLVNALTKLAILPGDTFTSTSLSDAELTKENYDLIILNIGINDFNAYISKLTGSATDSSSNKGAACLLYQKAVNAFYKRLIELYSNAKILVVQDDFTSVDGPGYWNKKAIGSSIATSVFTVLIPANGVDTALGSNGHANVQTHIWSADKISAWIESSSLHSKFPLVNPNITYDEKRDNN